MQKIYDSSCKIITICILFLLIMYLFLTNVCWAQEPQATEEPSATENQIRITDDTGYELVLQKPAQRLLALYGAFNELIMALGISDLLVGRTFADADIKELKHLPAVGTHMRPNIELILSLKPDVIIQFLGRQEAESLGKGLRMHGVPVLLFRMETFEDMYKAIDRIGQVTGHTHQAQELIAHYRERLGDVRRALLEEKRVRVFYEVRYPNLLAAGANSIVSDIIHTAGGSNVITLPGRVIRINEEELITKRPDVYIMQQGPMNANPPPLKERPHYAALPAVQNGRVLVVDQLAFARPGPRAVESTEMLARWLHPTVNFDLELD